MSLRKFVTAVHANPTAFMDPLDPIYLHILLQGYNVVDRTMHRVLRELDTRFPTRHNITACDVACLRFAPAEAVERLLRELLDVVEQGDWGAFEEQPEARQSCMVPVIDTIKQGRTAMWIGEPSLFHLVHYTRGFVAGLEVWYPERAKTQEDELASFEVWLQKFYNEPGVPWHRIMRVFYGGGQFCIDNFAKLWAQWQAESA